MGKLKIESLQKKINLKKLAKAVYTVMGQKHKIKAELVFETTDGIYNLNSTQRGVDSVTDVLSFPTLTNVKGCVLAPEDCLTELDGKYIFIGSIVLCEEKIRAQAIEYGNTEEKERNYLIIHGLLHLFGYDHMTEEDKKEMRAKEKEVLKLLLTKEEKLKQAKLEIEQAKGEEKPLGQPAEVIEEENISTKAEEVKEEQPAEREEVKPAKKKASTKAKTANSKAEGDKQ